jgi:hypothetical protein
MRCRKFTCDVPVPFPWNPCIAKAWERILVFVCVLAAGVASAAVMPSQILNVEPAVFCSMQIRLILRFHAFLGWGQNRSRR